MFATRLLSGIVLILIALLVNHVGGVLLLLTMLGISLIGMFELYRAVKVVPKGTNSLTSAAYTGAVLWYAAVWIGHAFPGKMDRLYAAGETACNGVHGRNRLASNSLLESLVFAKRAAKHIAEGYTAISGDVDFVIDETQYTNYQEEYKQSVLDAIEKERNSHE